jgi:hypothetical protein
MTKCILIVSGEILNCENEFFRQAALQILSSLEKGEAQFQDLPQIFKLSYNKYTAKKIITLPNGEPVEFDFYGVKLINNTRGVGDILGSRMLHIDMRTLPSNVTLPNNWPNLKLRELRNELHTWTFLGVAEIAGTYKKIMPHQQAREFEITAPLKVMAELARDDELKALLDSALKLQASKKGHHDGHPGSGNLDFAQKHTLGCSSWNQHCNFIDIA